jgi:hypothetical protein
MREQLPLLMDSFNSVVANLGSNNGAFLCHLDGGSIKNLP